MTITIFTPTYNRASLLPALYQSLLEQDNHNFEWIVGDDGSNDGTEALIRSYQLEGKIKIRYFTQANAGKHIAFNNGLRMADTPLFLNLDSDDKLLPDAVGNILEQWEMLQEHADLDSFAGMAGNKIYSDGSPVGTKPTYDVLDTTIIDFRFTRGIQGDKMEIFRTAVLKEFLFPENGERFCPEALVWNRIGSKYKFRFFNKALYQGDYLAGGLSEKIVAIRKKSPNNSATYYAELSQYDIPAVQKIKAGINYWRFAVYDHTMAFPKKLTRMNPLLSFVTLPIGLLFALKDRNK
ncbi:MAG: glycosyltransferase family 2 protein [Sphingobacteriales bacterium]|nr:MAG: glycosyltransferase family 2 protein [Sphingobacteriales bacterium]